MTAPALSQFQNGISQVSGDNLETFNQTCNVVADLRGFVGTAGIQVYLRGYTAINDGGQGEFYWNVAGTGPDDAGVTAVVPNGAAIGCWSRSFVTSQQVLGTKTNNNAPAGYLGEYVSSFISSSSPISIASATSSNLTSISLTAGDWDVYSQSALAITSGHTISVLYTDISTTSATYNINSFGFSSWLGSFAGDNSSILCPTGATRLSLASTTTVYLVIYQNSAANQGVWGGLWARRVR